MRRCIDCQQFASEIPCPCTKDNFYQVRDNWQGPGYRLYYGGERYVSQIDGEINGHVFDTVQAAKAYCLKRFGKIAKRTR